jgi:hypothetical protein
MNTGMRSSDILGGRVLDKSQENQDEDEEADEERCPKRSGLVVLSSGLVSMYRVDYSF